MPLRAFGKAPRLRAVVIAMNRFRHLCSAACSVLLSLVCLGAGREKVPALPEGVRTGTFSGWDRSIYLEAHDPDALAVVAPAVGGRVVHYGLHSQNILFELRAAAGQTLEKNKDLPWLGGFQCGLGAIDEARASSPVYSGAHPWTAPREMAVRVTGPADPDHAISIIKDFLMDPETGDLGIEQRAKNGGAQAYTGRLWSRTLCQSGGWVLVPVHRTSRLPNGWAVRKPDSTEYETLVPQCAQASLNKGFLVVQATGPAAQLQVESNAGWLAYVLGRNLFIQYFPVSRDPRPEVTQRLEIRVDAAATDLRILSPEFSLAAGAEHVVPLKWSVQALKKEANTAELIRGLASKVPRTPFAR